MKFKVHFNTFVLKLNTLFKMECNHISTMKVFALLNSTPSDIIQHLSGYKKIGGNIPTDLDNDSILRWILTQDEGTNEFFKTHWDLDQDNFILQMVGGIVLDIEPNTGNFDVLKLLFELGLNHGAMDNIFIRIACMCDNLNLAKFLLSYEEVDPIAQGLDSLLFASRNKNYEIVKLLLQHKRFNLKSKIDALHSACEAGRFKLAKLILEDKNVDPGVDNSFSFLLACKSGNEKLVSLLLEYPTLDVSATLFGNCIDYALRSRNPLVLKVLLQNEKVNQIISKDQLANIKKLGFENLR